MNKEEEESLKLFIVLSRAYRSLNESVNVHIYNSGLNPTEFAVLELLFHKGKQPLQQIGGKILLASGSITYVVDKLEKKELVKRTASASDRRVTYAEITDKGYRFIESFFPEHAKRIHNLVSILNPDEKEQAVELLKKLGLSVEKNKN
ncbi:MarR family winged helix-turn-helix transcriptional regulator [Lederbergia citrea]|uniref:MarR family transcriptional regulator n=1 Tax=Lederbergia citrea TaxID=2833581 RepID=A0A942UIT6_9BACI|nr:MarR family transcriptional regulator [Lederbergia citrea]MBS4203981.1 MarR family transcriptional regulator [Lederbergia citrea]MBS4221435.1 MarR family transcriptional regulator [Lederbergia citrea]